MVGDGAAGVNPPPAAIGRDEAGRRLRAARKAAGITAAEAARRAGIPYQRLSEWERGVCVCRWTEMVRVAAAAGYDPRILMPEMFAGAGPAAGR